MKKLFTEYKDKKREWNPYNSKAAAAMKKGLKDLHIKEGTKILYLGIAEGTTASHFSNIIGDKGVIYGVDIAAKPFVKLLKLCEERSNIIPILADANKIKIFEEYVPEKVDVIYEDLAQKTQTDILIKNTKRFLKNNGHVIYMVKARNIDVTKEPSAVFRKEEEKLIKAGLEIVEKLYLGPFSKDHACIVAKYKK